MSILDAVEILQGSEEQDGKAPFRFRALRHMEGAEVEEALHLLMALNGRTTPPDQIPPEHEPSQ